MLRVVVPNENLIPSSFRVPRHNPLAAAALLIAIALSPASPTHAQIVDWINTTGTPDPWFQDGPNWTGGTAPGPTDTARFDQPGTYEAWWDSTTASTTPEVQFLNILAGDLTFRKKGGGQHELTILGSSGSGSFSDFSISGSNTTLTNRDPRLHSLGGAQIISGGTLNLYGSHTLGAKLSVDGAVGFQVDGNLNVEAEGVISNTTGYIGHNLGSSGVATVTGIDSQWNNSNALAVGYSGHGTLNVESGAVVSNTLGYIGSFPSSMGEVTVSGTNSRWINSDFLSVGLFGHGTLNVEAGGVVNNTLGYLGYLSGSTGVATVTGSDSQWNNSSGLLLGGTATSDGGMGTLSLLDFGQVNVGSDMFIGIAARLTVSDFGSDGNLWVRNGSTITNSGVGLIGYSYGSTGEATVTGVGSQWNNSNDMYVGYYGSGTLNVEAGGMVSNTIGYIGYNTSSTGEANVTGSGSQWNNTNELFVGEGTLNVEAGGVVNNTTGSISGFSESTGVTTVTGNGSQWNNSLSLIVGNFGNGTLNVEAGGLVRNTGGYLGLDPVSTGVATVTGSGSQWNNSDGLRVGGSGNGTLNVEAGGVVSSTFGYIGSNYGSTSVATVTGIGSQWNNSSQLNVGGSGNGTLYVEASGVVSSTLGYIDGTSVATVTGSGSHWNNSSDLNVGQHGHGTLNVHAGGLVSNRIGLIGDRPSSTGVANVADSGSQWDNSIDLNVGHFGHGTLNVESGGVVSNTTGYIGRYFSSTGSTGEATVTGSGSQWNNSDSLFLGGDSTESGGTGTLNVQDSGLVSVANTLKIWETATLNLDGGTVRASTLDPAAGTLNWTSGWINLDNHLGNLAQHAGTLVVGNSYLTTAITGDYLLSGSGVLEIELASSGGVAGVDFDLLGITANATLGGTLDIALTGGFTPSAGDTFQILQAASVVGTFDTINLPALPDDLLWFVNYGATSVELVSTYAADFNEDGQVDDLDLIAWKGGFGSTPATHADGDANANTLATGHDFLTWQQQFTTPAAPLAAITPLPEPSTALLAALAIASLSCCRRSFH